MHEEKKRIEDLVAGLAAFEETIDIAQKKKRLVELERDASKPNLWDNTEEARKVMQELGDIQNEIKEVEEIAGEIRALSELVGEPNANSLEGDIEKLEARFAKLERAAFLSGKYDNRNAIVSIHAGQGGTEAMDWVSMLFRMYLRFAESQGWHTSVLSESKGEEAGIKSVVFEVEGRSAYGYLKRESGSHRLVRQSPFNADNLRQTSFALVEVLPEFEELDLPDIEIGDDDLDWQFYRSAGAGGQNVNKVSTAVRLTHKPSGIVVTAQTERKQEQNRKVALSHLRAKLWAHAQEEALKAKKEVSGEYTPASWGTQIRNYVLHPYHMVKDLRTQVETSDTSGVLDGKIEEFIEAGLRLTVKH